MYKRDALSIFQDLCCLTSGEQGSFLKIPQMSKSLALELIESILVSNPKAFVNVNPSLITFFLTRDVESKLEGSHQG